MTKSLKNEVMNEAVKRIKQLRDEASKTKDSHKKIELLEEALHLIEETTIPKDERILAIREYIFANERVNRIELNIEILEKEIASSLGDEDYSTAAMWIIDLSKHYFYARDAQKSMEIILQGLQYAEDSGNMKAKGALLLNLGLVNVAINAYDRALDFFQQAVDVIESGPDKRLLISAYLNLLNVNNNLAIYDDALMYAGKAIELSKTRNSIGDLAGAYINRGTTYSNMHRFDDAIDDFIKGIELLEESCLMPQWLLNGYVNLANMYIVKEMYDEANTWLQKALPPSEKSFDRNQQATVLALLGKLHIKRNNYEKALEYLHQAEELMEEKNLNKNRSLVFEQLAHVYSHLRKYKKKAEYLQKQIFFMQDGFPEDLNNRIANLKVRWETERKERESELLRKKNQELKRMNDELTQMYNKLTNAHMEILKLERKNSIFAMAVTANHEINQPLMIIKGNVEMLDMKYGNPDINPYISRIDEATCRIDRILSRYKEQQDYKMQAYADEIEMVVFDEKKE